MRIGVDVDGVLADFNKSFIERIVQITKRDLFPSRPFEIRTWYYPEAYGYTDGELATVWSAIRTDPYFWTSLSAYPETRAALRYLDERISFGDDVYFITARAGLDVKRQTETWLSSRWPYQRMPQITVLISEHKDLCAKALNLDVYIDDRDYNVQRVARERNFVGDDLLARDGGDTRVFLLDRPWNRYYSNAFYGIRRVSSVVGIATLGLEGKAAA